VPLGMALKSRASYIWWASDAEVSVRHAESKPVEPDDSGRMKSPNSAHK
jgi:hypothetical protein